MIDRKIKNEKGFSLIELMLAAALGIVVLGAAIHTYTKQDSLLRDESAGVRARDHARLAMDALLPNIRLAGFGFPAGDSGVPRAAWGITNADVTTLTYRASMQNISTNVARDAVATATGLVVPLDSADNIFFANDTVVFYDVVTPTNWAVRTVSAVGNNVNLGDPVNYDTLSMSGVQNGFAVEPQAGLAPVVVHKYHTVVCTYNAGAQTITITDDQGTADGGTDDVTTTIANNVTDLTFRYFDAAGAELTVLTTGDPTNATALGNVREIQASITVVDPNSNGEIDTTLMTNLHLRNMGI